MFLDIIHRPVYLKTLRFGGGFCIRLQIKHTQLEIGTSSIDLPQLTTFHLKAETESSLRNIVS
jgi:hypothetical protein